MTQKLRDVKRGRPFPKDPDRKARVMAVVWDRGLSVSDLANSMDVDQSTLSKVIWGVRRSPVMETRIAAYFGMTRDELFPRKRAESRRDAA